MSDNPLDYLNSDFIYDKNETYLVELEAKKKVIFAGEEAVNKILKEIGEKPLEPAETYFHGPHDGTDRDFLMKNAEIGEKFIKRAIQKGYSGVRDPYDDMTIGYSKTAKILFDLDQDFKVNNAKKVRFK